MQFFTSAQIGCVDISYLCANNNKKTTIMPANKNALIRYKTIDNCLRNRYRRWTLKTWLMPVRMLYMIWKVFAKVFLFALFRVTSR